ncbi:MAG TPA: hypothetical protein PLJ88_04455, partial [Agitococcus sp.]|nr:hypothetical protein [Agitococcus sp.]
VGVFAVPRLHKDRITQAVDELANQEKLVLFEQWQHSQKMAHKQSFCEAQRAAQWLLEQEGLWLHATK